MSTRRSDNGHEIVPVLNKVDLPASEPDKVRQQIEDVIGIDAANAVLISAKTGQNVPEVLEAIVHRLPAPKGDREAPLKALLVDSWYDTYLGVVVLVRVVDGTLRKHQRIRMMRTHAAYDVERVGVFTPKIRETRSSAPARSASSTPRSRRWPIPGSATPSRTTGKPTAAPLPGFRPTQPVVFCGLFPVDAAEFEDPARGNRQAAPQRCELHFRDGDLGGRSASAFAAAFSAYCISRSSRSGWRASSISI